MKRLFLSIVSSILFSAAALAAPPSLNRPLPAVSIADRGEIVLKNEEYSYSPWRYQNRNGEVHILQYFAGTQSASETFKPLTDQLKVKFPDGGYHVTTVINLDAAMWGTGGIVTSKAKSSKAEYPLSTMVLDEDGEGEKSWQLGKKGALLAVMDKSGNVIYFSQVPLSEHELAATLVLIEGALEG